MRTDERLFWGSMVVSALVVGWTGAVLLRDPKLPPSPLPPDTLLQGRIEALERRADEQARIRCLNVTTPKFDMMIVQTENLGKAKVAKP